MAEQMFSHSPNFIAIDMNDYNRIKSSSSYLNATSVEMPHMCLILNAVDDHFGQRDVIEKQILHVTSSIDKSICQKVNIVWGLSNRKSGDANGYEINIIVGYK
jgi:hypothetical protein